MGSPCLTPRQLENQGEGLPLIRRENEVEERQELIQETQEAGKRILWRVARIAVHSIVSKAFSMSTLAIILGGLSESYSNE